MMSRRVTRQFNLADLFEVVVDTVPDRLALVAGDRRLTYRQLDQRANRLPTTCVTGASTPVPTWGSWPTTGPNGSRR